MRKGSKASLVIKVDELLQMPSPVGEWDLQVHMASMMRDDPGVRAPILHRSGLAVFGVRCPVVTNTERKRRSWRSSIGRSASSPVGSVGRPSSCLEPGLALE